MLLLNECVLGLFKSSVERETMNFGKHRTLISKYDDLYEISVLVLKIITIRNIHFFVANYPLYMFYLNKKKVTTQLQFKTMSLSSSAVALQLLLLLLLLYQFKRLTSMGI